MGVLEDKARARVFYKYLSKCYDLINPFIWTADMRENALDRLDFPVDSRVLDVGCGTGFGTEGLLTESADIHGLDQSIHQLKKAINKLGDRDEVEFYLGDAERLPFRDDTFDIVWSSGSIEYWPDPVETLTEIRRVCAPGGQVLIVGPNSPKTRIMRAVADSIMLFYDESEADRMFREAGYGEVTHWTIGPRYNREIAIVSLAQLGS